MPMDASPGPPQIVTLCPRVYLGEGRERERERKAKRTKQNYRQEIHYTSVCSYSSFVQASRYYESPAPPHTGLVQPHKTLGPTPLQCRSGDVRHIL